MTETRPTIASTPSSAAGTRANDDFNALIRQTDAVQADVAGEATPDEVVADALRASGVEKIVKSALIGSLAFITVQALRDAGYDL